MSTKSRTYISIVIGARLTLFSSQREALKTLQSDLKKLEQLVQEKQRELTRCDEAIDGHKQETKRCRLVMQQADSLVDELQDALDADAIEEGRLEALKLQLAEAQEEVTTHESSYGECIVAKDKNNVLVRTTRDEMAALDKRIEEAEAKVRKAESKATKCANQRSAALRDKNAAFDAVAETKGLKERCEKDRNEQATVVETFTIQATEFCPRVPVDEGETEESIERKYGKLEKDLAAAEKR